jgi:uncharacterized membrane protein
VSKTRFEAFSDSVFAFAITLLVLGIAIPALPAPSEDALRAALISRWPDVIAYALSFAVIGLLWQNHHAIFRLVDRIDRRTIAYNLLLLAGIAFIPFATSTLGAYPTLHASTFLYGMVLTYCSIMFNLLLRHLVVHGAIQADISAATVRAYRIGFAVYVLATLIALLFPVASFAAYVAIVGYYLVPQGLDADIDA